MELMIFITVLCISVSLLQTPCAAASWQIQLALSHDQQAYNNNEVQLSLPPLPRKLRVLTAQVKGHAAQDKISHNNPKKDVPAGNTKRLDNKEQGGGTWQKGMEGGDTSQYFTMDYSPVKRRRPIHNQSLPAGP